MKTKDIENMWMLASMLNLYATRLYHYKERVCKRTECADDYINDYPNMSADDIVNAIYDVEEGYNNDCTNAYNDVRKYAESLHIKTDHIISHTTEAIQLAEDEGRKVVYWGDLRKYIKEKRNKK